MNEIDLWEEAENCENDTIQYDLFQFFSWSDYPTNENDFDEIYNRIHNGERFYHIIKEKQKEK
jgi:hypothetical protein|tara:strand:+ start:2073 stop:2261 length:189 start_codon:yes stop_codon:yes gene_type:complete